MYSVIVSLNDKGSFETFYQALQVFVPSLKEQIVQGVGNNALKNSNLVMCSRSESMNTFSLNAYQTCNVALKLGFVVDSELVDPPPSLSETEVLRALIEEAFP